MEYNLSQLEPLVSSGSTNIIDLGKLVALETVSGCALGRFLGNQLPAVYNVG